MSKHKGDVKPTTVDKVAERIKRTNPSLTSEQAHRASRDQAERINRERKDSK